MVHGGLSHGSAGHSVHSPQVNMRVQWVLSPLEAFCNSTWAHNLVGLFKIMTWVRTTMPYCVIRQVFVSYLLGSQLQCRNYNIYSSRKVPKYFLCCLQENNKVQRTDGKETFCDSGEARLWLKWSFDLWIKVSININWPTRHREITIRRSLYQRKTFWVVLLKA